MYFEDVSGYIAATRSSDPRVRKLALKNMCPCRVLKDVDVIWDRVLEMTVDEDVGVRYQTVHSLCDGSPRSREEQIVAALRGMRNDSDEKIRRAVRRALCSYERTGRWNVL